MKNFYNYENTFVPQLTKKLKPWQYQMGYYLNDKDTEREEGLTTKVTITSEYELPTRLYKKMIDDLLMEYHKEDYKWERDELLEEKFGKNKMGG